MNLPIQSQPVIRNVSTAAFTGGMQASDAGCIACCLACDLLPWGQKICKLGCEKIGGCSC